jgi:hypothetical protein
MHRHGGDRLGHSTAKNMKELQAQSNEDDEIDLGVAEEDLGIWSIIMVCCMMYVCCALLADLRNIRLA